MAAGDIKIAYAASASFTVTNLHGLLASQTFIAGWESNSVDNTTNLYTDYLISGLLKAATDNNQIGTVRVYVVAMNADATWPSDKDTAFDGTESAEAIAADLRDAVCKLGCVINASAATASQIYSFGPFSVANLFGGVCPAKFVIYITGNIATTTADQFAADTNIVTYKGVYNTVAQS
jgi:hypothetical protein